MDFDELVNRRGTHCAKWDKAHVLYEVSGDYLPMWIADTDFRLPDFVLDAGRAMLDHGVLGYGYDVDGYLASVRWWMETRHGWSPEPGAIFTVGGLGNAIGLCFDVFSAPGDAVITFNPVYPEFEAAIRGADRVPVQVEMARDGDRYVLDLDAAEAALTGREKILLFCSPHNPVGRVWNRAELESVAEFAQRHDLILISDEIHHDLVYPGHRHIPMVTIDGIADRLVVLTAASKTFTLPGLRVGNVIIPDAALRAPFAARMKALKQQPPTLSCAMVTAAQSPEGAAWADDLVAYLDGNRQTFAAGIADIPGLRMTPMEATFLAWVDFSGTGMAPADFTRRVERDAGIAASRGTTFGPGGDDFLRFNLGTQRARIEDAVARLTRAFGDLQ